MKINIARYLDSTYLKTPEQAGLSEEQTFEMVKSLIKEAINHHLFAVMIRPTYVAAARAMIDENNAEVILGTVIGFHEGNYSVDEKLSEALTAIENGADELDFVINYKAYLNANISLVEDEFLRCTQLCLNHNKVAKWIIEIAALSDSQIADLTGKIAKWAEINFSEDQWTSIFVKSSTGFFKTENNKPNGATFEGVKIMLDNAGKLPVKAAGGVRTPEDAEKMIKMGVKRIGTSSALALITDQKTDQNY